MHKKNGAQPTAKKRRRSKKKRAPVDRPELFEVELPVKKIRHGNQPQDNGQKHARRAHRADKTPIFGFGKLGLHGFVHWVELFSTDYC
jgi:hypothetical protein